MTRNHAILHEKEKKCEIRSAYLININGAMYFVRSCMIFSACAHMRSWISDTGRENSNGIGEGKGRVRDVVDGAYR